MLNRLRTADPTEFMHPVLRDGIIDRSPTYRVNWLGETQGDDGKLPYAPDGDQRQCISMMLDKPLSMLSGPPGTGKSFVTAIFIRMLVEAFYRSPPPPPEGRAPLRFEVATPTARAAGALRKQLEQLGVYLDKFGQDICTLQCVRFPLRFRPTDGFEVPRGLSALPRIVGDESAGIGRGCSETQARKAAAGGRSGRGRQAD